MDDSSVTEGQGRFAPILKTLLGGLAGPNPSVNTPNEAGRVAGFKQGLWHGTIAPITLIISLFRDDVHVYEVHNNGKGYIFGFLMGVTGLWGGSRMARRH